MKEIPADTYAELLRKNEELRWQLEEAEELILAIRTGAVDALAVHGADGPQIFTLHGADQGYRTLIEQMNEGALLLSQDATVLYCNACLAGWLQYALEEVMGSSVAAFIPLAFHGYWRELLAQGWAGKSRGEMPLQTRDLSLRPFSVSMNRLLFNDTPVLAVIITDLSAQQKIQDIQALVTEQNAVINRKNEELEWQTAARQAVEQAAAEARRMLEGIPQIAWTASAEGKNTYLNRRWFDYVGQYEPRDWPDPLLQSIHPEDVEAATTSWLKSLATADALEVECRLRNQHGEYRWMLGRALPSRNSQGEIIQWIGTYTDIHEQKLAMERVDQAQRELQEYNAQLTRVNVDLDNFIYTASHDLKAPINNIEGLLYALLSELPSGSTNMQQVQPILDMMQDSVDRFKRTIEHLTEVTKLQKENDQPATLVALGQVIKDVCLDLAPLFQEAEAVLEIDVEECSTISFAEKNLRSVVYNLLSNALKYHAPNRKGRVSIRCHEAGDYVLLQVQDNGLGLDVTKSHRLFNMFQRFHDHVEGSGIGLYMVKKILENAGGRIEVESELGVGSTFSAYFRRR
ncbi:PAS domain-containing protein [Hymenobacter taeanensis]|uniref:histidine kinase n=1 Tax=Hymenobacter taeanensis TaxID=2735321 RepID=A0A6M6BD26_9BACT|nr:ATP-binding protein [Hymenobacter taeanensis]QJX45909.1 PAS domain-containing protein [Hymenobacter taeanensis]